MKILRHGLLFALFILPTVAQAQNERRFTMQYGGVERSYYVHKPPGKTGPLPLVIMLHGGGGGAMQALDIYPIREVADREGFIVVAPNGTGPFRRELLRTWNVKFGFGYAQKNNVDDVGFVRALILELEKDPNVDKSRVYLTGLSNGAILCNFAGAANADLLAGIAPVVGTVGGREENERQMQMPTAPRRPLDVVMFNGDFDQAVPVRGGLQGKWQDGRKFMLSSLESAKFWAQANGCNPTPKVEELPAQKCSRTTWSGGRNGTRVILYVLHNQGHAWPGGLRGREQADAPSPNLLAHEVLWKFFSERNR